jgi:hypothetical protein
MEMMKIDELREIVGRVFYDKNSSTLRSELMSVSECGQVCVTKEVASPYSFIKATPKPGTKNESSEFVWYRIFY